MTDQDILDQALPLYESGLGIKKIASTLSSSAGRVTRLLRSHGIDTRIRASYTKEKLKHPYSLVKPMEEYGWTRTDVVLACNTYKDQVRIWRRDGLSLEEADGLALALGKMPQDLWDNWWDFE